MTAFLGPLILLAWGGYGALVGGLQVFNGILLVIGFVLMGVVLLDYPWRSEIGPDGVVRRCALRTERLNWQDVRSIARPGARQRLPSMNRGGDTDRPKVATGRAGLVAEVGKRPYLLADRIESPIEHEAIQTGLSTWAPTLMMRAARPVEGTPPTWLYKRRKSEIEGMVDWR